MPTRQQLESALINADKAGDTAAATQLANALKGGQYDDVPRETKDKSAAGTFSRIKDQINKGIMSIPGSKPALEFTSAVNRGVTDLAEFLTTDQINNVSELAGQGRPVPTVEEFAPGAVTGDYMEPGLAREAIQTGGELIGPGAAAGASLRTAAQALPKLATASEGLLPAITRQMGGSTAGMDVASAGLSGIGLETGGEVGEMIGGEKGRAAGEMIGALGLPISATIIKDTGSKLVTNSAKKLLNEAAPTIEGLKQTARGIYNDISNLGASVYSRSTDRLAGQLRSVATKEGYHPTLHPKVTAALNSFDEIKGVNQSVSQIDTLRKITQAAASSNDLSEKRLGTMLVNKIDDYLDDLAPKDFRKGGGEVGAKFKDARQLWSRAKKSEMINDAFEKAKLQATGFENGIRVQFRQILNNKKKLRGFTKEEIEAMRKVVKGGTAENMAKMIGRFGFNEGQASNMLMGSLGIAAGGVVGGVPGAVAVPLVGQISRNLAQKLTRNSARAADNIIRAGSNGHEITKAYLKSIPKGEQSAKELAELLLRPEVAIGKIQMRSVPEKAKKLVADAVFFANAIRKQDDD